MTHRARIGLIVGVVALVTALGYGPPASATTPARSSGSDQPPGRHCVVAEEARAREAGGDDDAPPNFSAAFYKHSFVLDASLDGMEGRELPLSIEAVCGIPRRRAKEAVQLVGADGIALLLDKTTVWLDRKRLRGEAATTALDGADTASLRVRLAGQRSWQKDDEGNPVPTFRARRIRITD